FRISARSLPSPRTASSRRPSPSSPRDTSSRRLSSSSPLSCPRAPRRDTPATRSPPLRQRSSEPLTLPAA
ncbi:hypothetical protein PENTCL1PPCAC_25856, partial [Pristionchus entomophagus]